jgi:methyl-accepting chemotaxis protein
VYIFDWLRKKEETSGSDAILEALGRSLAIIEFEPNGTILRANKNFCDLLGYAQNEIVGKHHSLFVEPAQANSQDYRDFWAKLARGEFDAREYKRIGRGGKEVWIQASYNPVFDAQHKVQKVVKVATDITREKLKAEAISRVQAVIEFAVDGTILNANGNFLRLVGYRLDEIKGKHHRIFVDSPYSGSTEYADFWRKLNRGEFIAGEFQRVGKDAKEVWLNASYNPIFDADGHVTRIVKFATDITERVRMVQEIGDGLGRLAHGDLRQRLTRTFLPQFEKLRLDFNTALESLDNALGNVIGGAKSIEGLTHEIASAADDLSRRTENQAANLEETATAVRTINQTIQKTANGAANAHQMVTTAKANAEASGEVVKKAVDAMHKIERSAVDIEQIIGTIDEIAFQTNLLALNAGVEAARAGEAGRGFAVVASEVRALAQRSAEAAKEIKTLIAASSSEVTSGVRLVVETGQALGSIAAQVLDINKVVTEIAESAAEQSASVDQVNVAISQMNGDTQKNVAMVEETTAASHMQRNAVETLVESVSMFRVSNDSDGRAPPRTAASAQRVFAKAV